MSISLNVNEGEMTKEIFDILVKRKIRIGEGYRSLNKAIRNGRLVSKLFKINFDVVKDGKLVNTISNVNGEILTLNASKNDTAVVKVVKKLSLADKIAKFRVSKVKKEKYNNLSKSGKAGKAKVKLHKKYDTSITKHLHEERALRKRLSDMKKEGVSEKDPLFIRTVELYKAAKVNKKEAHFTWKKK